MAAVFAPALYFKSPLRNAKFFGLSPLAGRQTPVTPSELSLPEFIADMVKMSEKIHLAPFFLCR